MDTIITITNVSKSYGEKKAIDNLSLNVKQGEFYGFLGPNGAGKTTTIRMITGIIPPDAGEIKVRGFTLSEREKIARIIGVIPESDGFYSWMGAEEYLSFFASLYEVKKGEQTDRITKLLKDVDLLSSKNIAVGTYSRGMKKRLGLARALINNPQVLFLDEPTLGLDPQGQEDIQNLLQKLNKEGVTIFLSSHLLPEVSNLCTRIAVINKGKLIAEGTMEELRQKTKLKERYFVKIEGDKNIIQKHSRFTNNLEKMQATGSISEFIYNGDKESANSLVDFLREKKITLLELRTQNDNLTDIFLSLTRNN